MAQLAVENQLKVRRIFKNFNCNYFKKHFFLFSPSIYFGFTCSTESVCQHHSHRESTFYCVFINTVFLCIIFFLKQPRRLAAQSVAKRVCRERGWPLGQLVGYKVGLDKSNSSKDTRYLDKVNAWIISIFK